jgi:cell division protein FtsQ
VRKFLRISFVLILIVALSFLIGTKRLSYQNVKCENLNIQVDTQSDLFFVNADMIQGMIEEKEDSILGKRYQDINIYLLEEFLDAHPNVKKAELYLTIDGDLCVDVKQRKPLVRIFEQDASYYLDEHYERFSLSDRYSARVLQVYWSEMTASRKETLDALMKLIAEDAFLKAQITAVAFDEDDEIMIFPRVGNHKILMGEARDLDKKFENLKVFYKRGLEKVGWDRYTQISLKFENQVVCTKR